MSDMQVLQKLAKAVSFKYKGNCAPNVLVSWLPTSEWYVSINQYGSSHKDKKVVHSVKHADLTTAVKMVTEKFLSSVSVEKNPVDELRDEVSK